MKLYIKKSQVTTLLKPKEQNKNTQGHKKDLPSHYSSKLIVLIFNLYTF